MSRPAKINTPRLTRDQAAILGAYTGVLCGPWLDLEAYSERKLGEGIGPVGMAALHERLRDAAREDFLAICAPLHPEKNADGAP